MPSLMNQRVQTDCRAYPGMVYFMNVKTKHSQWRAPPEFDGTFVLCDDVTGFIASTRLQANVTTKPTEPESTTTAQPSPASSAHNGTLDVSKPPPQPQSPPHASNADIQDRLSSASGSANTDA
eukprot:m.104875 g.104875  ORF g.104875 m.104875 type:complete len:123 (+) comp10541_c0_seq5:543-911(+)